MPRSIFEISESAGALQNLADGSASSLPIAFDDGSGIYQSSNGLIDFSIQGSRMAYIDSSGITSLNRMKTDYGSNAAPAYSFISNSTSGMYATGPTSIGLAAGGNTRLQITSGQVLAVSSGTSAAPDYSFTTDTNTGIYTSAADTIDFATNATNRLSINNASLTSTLPILAPSGTIANPSYSFSTDSSTGMNLMALHTIGLSTGGVNRLIMTDYSNQFYNPVTITSGPVSDAYLTINITDRTYRSANNGSTVNQVLQIGPTTGDSTAYLGVDHNPGFSDVGLNYNMRNSGNQIIRTAFIMGNSSTYSSTTAGSETGNMRFYVKPSAASAVEVLRLKPSTTTDAAAYFRDGTSSNPSISFQGAENTGIWRHTASGQICFSVAGTIPLVLNTTFVIPYVDLGASLGLSNYRWTVVYAQNGTIQTSDVNLKTNVEPTPLGLDFINRLNPIRYKWAEVKDQDGKTIQSAGTRYHYGLIAQEVKTVLDDIKITTQDAAFFTDSSITEDSTKPARYGLNYTELICPIIKSIKELKAADISYSADIVTLKANINTCLQNIESRLSRIESLALINLNHLPAVGQV
jgi:hypothetical protein